MGRTDGAVKLREIKYDTTAIAEEIPQSEARFKGFSGPIGSGKSQALCQEAIRLSYMNPGRLGLLGAPTYPMLRDATQGTLFEILDSNGIPFEHNKAENTLVMKDTGSRILFRPVDEFERLRGTKLAWFGLDELTYTQEGAWLRLEGRLRDPRADAPVRIRGVDAEGLRLGLPEVPGGSRTRVRGGGGEAAREPVPAGPDSGLLRAVARRATTNASTSRRFWAST